MRPLKSASHKAFLPRAIASAVFCVLSAASLAQDLALPELSGPLAETAQSHAFLSSGHQRVPVDLAAYGYLEEEYLLSGEAGVYDWPQEGALQVLARAPYVTRILVRRPAADQRFSGIVIVEALNPSTPVDLPIMYGASWEQFIKDGVAWVGVTVKPNTMEALRRFDALRYGALAMPHAASGPVCAAGAINAWSQPTTPQNETGLVWDMLTQLGVLLKSDTSANPLSSPAKWLYMTGQSQTAGYARTYATVFARSVEHMRGAALYDGYLYSGSPPWQVPLHQCMASFPEGDPRLITGPAGVPVIEFFAQGDIGTNISSRRADSDAAPDLYRRYEVAGGAHVDPYTDGASAATEDVRRAAGAAEGGGPAICAPLGVEDSDFPIHYQFDAGWRLLHRWVANGEPAPRAEWLRLQDDAATNFDPAASFLVDAHGNALGGVRSPYVDVPIARWIGAKNTDFSCMFYGYKVPFEKSVLAELYPRHTDYVNGVERSVKALQAERWLTPEDGAKIVQQAAASSVP